MAAQPQGPINFGPSLALAEKWINETGRPTTRNLSNPLPDGTQVPVLLCTHGMYNVAITEQAGCLFVQALAQISEDVRKKLADLTPETKQKVLIALNGELSSNSRTGYSFQPPDARAMDEVQGFFVQQLLKISESDVGSFNRLCDAIQEVVTVLGKGIRVLGLFGLPQDTSTVPVRPASSALYG